MHKRARHCVQDGGDAFVPDFRHGFVVVSDDEAEALGEAFITAVTCAEGMAEEVRDELVDDELDGLVVEMSFDELEDDLLQLS